jgi:hypothetical protein
MVSLIMQRMTSLVSGADLLLMQNMVMRIINARAEVAEIAMAAIVGVESSGLEVGVLIGVGVGVGVGVGLGAGRSV